MRFLFLCFLFVRLRGLLHFLVLHFLVPLFWFAHRLRYRARVCTQANAAQAQVTLLDNYPDCFRALAQGRADAMVDVAESVVIPMRNFQGVQWKILDEVLASFWVGIGVQKGNTALRDVLNVVLFELHRTNFVNQTWEKWFGVPMTTRIPFNPMF